MPELVENVQVGKREDLADVMALVDVKATPFTSRVNKSGKATNSEFDWLVDNYAAPDATGIVDGTDVSSYENHAVNRARLGNYVQIKRRTAKVSRLAEDLSNVAAVSSEIGLAAKKKLVELKRDIETVCLGGNDGQADNGSLPYLTIGLDLWIDTTGPTLPRTVPAAYRPASAQVVTTACASLTEDTDIQGILTSIFDTTGMNGEYVLFAGSVLRRRFTDMTRTIANTTSTATKVRTFNLAADSGKIQNTTTIYQGDYGTIEIESSSFIGMSSGSPDTDRGYLLDMDKIHLRYNKMPTVEKFPDLGGGPRIMVESIFGLQVDNPIGLGKFKP